MYSANFVPQFKLKGNDLRLDEVNVMLLSGGGIPMLLLLMMELLVKYELQANANHIKMTCSISVLDLYLVLYAGAPFISK
jgi:hypothetical protein